ncbi:hypothetical protein ASF24_14195 [Methylobacterium sp. Leaf86]|uniref:hypothetical protein n=1 Tax=Methylobacterium sp. Leaf86 TaxID=1736242 RepID=UPI0006FBE38B|nr:hypothetical protein [Methylobacterium sp. Leaf86]KQO59006.1 hypothetical protein ASF24_14195 [Methylobacterium sp. Leaf86]
MKLDLPATRAHDSERCGTVAPFAALDVTEGMVIGCSMLHYRHHALIRFLRAGRAANPGAWKAAFEVRLSLLRLPYLPAVSSIERREVTYDARLNLLNTKRTLAGMEFESRVFMASNLLPSTVRKPRCRQSTTKCRYVVRSASPFF